MLFGFVMKKLFAVVVLMMLVWHHAFALDLNITLSNAGDLINQVDVSKLDEVESLTIAGDLNGTDILVIRKMVNLKILDMTDANIVNGGNSYYKTYITSENVIGAYFFIDNTKLESIKLPKSAITIGDKVFSGCSDLTSVKIGESTTYIGKYVFEGCEKLSAITIPSNVTLIDDFAFKGCTSLEKVTLSDGTEQMHVGHQGNNSEFQIFEDCPLKTLYIGRDVVFENYSSSIISPFAEKKSLEVLTIGNTVTMLQSALFFDCDSIKSVILPNSLQSIGRCTFGCCDGLTSIVIPQSVSFIDGQAFWKSENIESVTIEGSPIVGGDIFEGCHKFKSIHILNMSSWLKIVYKGSWGMSYRLYLNDNEVNDLVIPNDIEIVREYAFYGCKSLESVTIPQNVKRIERNAFSITNNDLRKVVIEDGDEDIQIGGLFSSSVSVDTFYMGRNYPFHQIIGLNHPDSPLNNFGIRCLVIGDSVKVIREDAFSNIKQLEEITIGKGVVRIESDAFKGCTNLNAIYISDLQKWLGFSFVDMTDNPLYYSGHLYVNNIEIRNLVVPENIKKISQYAFVNCSSLESVTIGNSITYIGGYAFSGCSGLTSVTIPNSVTSIGIGAFQDCI